MFTNYGQIDPDLLHSKKESVRNMTFALSEQLTTVYTAIEDLQELGRAAELPFSPEQLIEIALAVLRRVPDFHRAIEEWYTFAPANRTWLAFKTHFTQNELY